MVRFSKSANNNHKRLFCVVFPAIKVTRLGEFSPSRRLLTLGSQSKIAEVAQSFALLFPNIQVI
jgi:hypothetical protein